MMNEDIKIESIGAGVSIFTSKQHRFGTDAILLADFASPGYSDKAMDLGTGCGIIPFLWLRGGKPKTIHCAEIQPNAAELIQKTAEQDEKYKKVKLFRCDLREIEKEDIELYSYSLVTMNPPYKPINTGIENSDQSQKIARHELMCSIYDVCRCADKLLKFGGRLCICMRPERLADITDAMRQYKIEPKRIRFVSYSLDKEPFLVLAEGRKGGNKGLRVLPELCIADSSGALSREMKEIYGDYGDGTK